MNYSYPPGTSPTDRVRLLREYRVRDGLCATCGQPREREHVKQCDVCIRKNSASSLASYRSGASVEQIKIRRQRQRGEAIAKYGGSCACCGEGRPQFLTFDHAADNGKAHRLETAGHRSAGNTFVRWLLSNPRQSDIRLLCWNCHQAGTHYGACPHEVEREATG